MGNSSSPLRKAIRQYDVGEAKRILEDAGQSSSDVINEDQSADCILDILCCNVKQQLPMFTVVAQGHVEMAIVLTKYGADLEARGASDGETIMHIAVGTNIKMVKLIHEYASNLLNEFDYNDRSPLHWLCMRSTMGAPGGTYEKTTLDILDFVLDKINPDMVKKQDSFGRDALFYAKQNKLYAIIKRF